MGQVEIGISGWAYKGWRGSFYPHGLSRKDELYYASRILPTIEINSTFYSLRKPVNFRHWYEVTPRDFIFSIKANRYITHVKKLKNIEIPLANFFTSGILELKEKLGPILWQFPPTLKFDPERFETFLKLLPRSFEAAMKAGKNHRIRHAVEMRNDSFLNPLFVDLLRTYNTALVMADTGGRWPYLEDVTSDFIYIRLHGHTKLYQSGYDDQSLDNWCRRIKTWKEGGEPFDRVTISDDLAAKKPRDVFVYFDNDAKVHAPWDAQKLMQKLNKNKNQRRIHVDI